MALPHYFLRRLHWTATDIMNGPMGMRPGIILLREGTDTSQVSAGRG